MSLTCLPRQKTQRKFEARKGFEYHGDLEARVLSALLEIVDCVELLLHAQPETLKAWSLVKSLGPTTITSMANVSEDAVL